MSTVELAWAAGFFDGEGTVGLWKVGNRPKSRRLSSAVTQKVRAPLDEFCRIVECGVVRGPYYSKDGFVKFIWNGAVNDTLVLFDKLKPYLKHKGIHFASVIEAYKEYKKGVKVGRPLKVRSEYLPERELSGIRLGDHEQG